MRIATKTYFNHSIEIRFNSWTRTYAARVESKVTGEGALLGQFDSEDEALVAGKAEADAMQARDAIIASMRRH